ncbi:MAG: alpha/beta fold hydrolase [Myxococcales bacterium]|nr:alpha/beta fold hydrolase [Myxococcales bacterium]MCB9520165.1 alpha/beta fold hydrolase [Myxococcales bacterium]MCB9531213.1 alpha/beta fold hydrolase [Myxococcales bacterium]
MTLQPVGAGRALYWEESGDGPPLLLLNGMSQSTANWLSHVRPLGERFRTLTYDARGQGRSPLGDVVAEPVTLEGHVDDLAELLDGVGLDHVSLCGFSHGARLALAFAARHPRRVDRLVLTSTGDNDDPMRRAIVRSWAEVLERGGLEAMAWCSMPDILGRDFLAANERFLEAMVRATVQRNDADGLRALLAGMAGFGSPLDDAAALHCPALLISSPDDLLVSRESAKRLAAALPDGAHVWIDGCGHTIPIEAPERWRSVVETFLLR